MSLSDNEIIKALECCGNIVDSTCKKCVYHKTYNASCVVRLMRDALDLLKRKDAENESKEIIIERLKECVNEAYSEAVKEFKKTFEKKIKDVKFTLGQTWEIQNALKDTLKEMVGDDNA